MLEGVGFTANSCAMIFADWQVAPAVKQTVSENPILQARGSSLQKKNGLSSLQLTALPHPDMKNLS